MVKTRRSLNGVDVDENYRQKAIDGGKCVPDWSQRELRSNRYRVWPTKLVSRRLRTIKMPRIVYPESDTDPEKYSRRRPVRVFFAGQPDAEDVRKRRAGRSRNMQPPNNYMEDSGDKPIQQICVDVRRSGRQRKLLHHNFNESWITNELKVKGYPGLYGIMSTTSDSSSEDEQARRPKRETRTSNEATHNERRGEGRSRRTSARSSATKKHFTLKDISDSEMEFQSQEQALIDAAKSESADIEKVQDSKRQSEQDKERGNKRDNQCGDEEDKDLTEDGDVKEENIADTNAEDSESNQGRGGMRLRRSRPPRSADMSDKKDSQRETASDSERSSDSGSAASAEMEVRRQLRRSNRTRKPKNNFVEMVAGKRERTQTRTKRSYITKKPYSLRERKPNKIIVRSQSPTTSSGSSSDSDSDVNGASKSKTKGRQKSKSTHEHTDRALKEIQPIELDGSVKFSSVGGLAEHIQCLREMVLFPLMYPELFKKFNTRPAKGVLFHGPPGTGKTLLATALANECTLQGGQKVSFFLRKGADCLKKWVGESERHLKVLFQQASKMKPSIIFFDEIDALAPVRSVRQDQVHTSVVGTLLAEMSGLSDRGEVVIIGATNRIDAVDPALRRAGRFDRELYFPPPNAGARLDILRIHTSQWQQRPPDRVLQDIANDTNGYGGSDLKALCSEAVLKALRRTYPQVYQTQHALVIDPNKVLVERTDLVAAMRSLVAAGARTAPPPARPLPSYVAPLLQGQASDALAVVRQAFPHACLNTSGNIEEATVSAHSSSSNYLPTVLMEGQCADTHIAPAVLAALEHCTVKEISLASLNSTACQSHEQAILNIFAEARRAERGCVLYLPCVDIVWSCLGEASASLTLQLWTTMAAGLHTLLLATTQTPYDDLPEQLQSLFPPYKDCIYTVREPTVVEVINFLKPVMLTKAMDVPCAINKESLPELPRAPPPPPPRPSAEELSRRKRVEDYKLRELRIFLRDVCRKLAANRRFYKFTKPVDLEEVTDYLDIVKEPMDLETMMTKVDMHRYSCAKEFLTDVDLICANALEYNPDRTSSDKQIRHEACSLRDHAHALIDVEMDSDFEAECREISRRRAQEGILHDTDLPSFIYTAKHKPDVAGVEDLSKSVMTEGTVSEASPLTATVRRKRRRNTAWSKGFAKKPKTSHKSFFKEEPQNMITDEESKENKPMETSPHHNGEAKPTATASPAKSTSSQERDLLESEDQEDSMESLRDQTVLLREPKDGSHLISDRRSNGDSTLIIESPRKSCERTTTSSTPPKRRHISNRDSTSDGETKIVISKTELECILFKNAKHLRTISLNALLNLHCQLDSVVCSYLNILDRSQLPTDLYTVVDRYLQKLTGRK